MRFLCLIWVCFCSCTNLARTSPDTLDEKPVTVAQKQLCNNVVGVFNRQTQCNENYVFDPAPYALRLDTLAQVRFWRSIMRLHEDSAIVNLANSRDVVQKICIRDWNLKNDSL